jgi:DNA-binding transcriptional regulator YiaG
VNPVRAVRLALRLSQPEFARRLGVSAESYRTWDSGRRDPPATIVARAFELANSDPGTLPMPLSQLARELRVSEVTLRRAARTGRLAVIVDAPRFLGKPFLRATREAGAAFMTVFYRQTSRWTTSSVPAIVLPDVPPDYDRRLRQLRVGLHVTQSELATKVGAAGKAVIYQWESRKRKPTAIMWRRVLNLARRPAGRP